MKTILLAEDDAALSQMCALTLRAAGYAVITVENGDAAVATLALNPIDLLVVDMFMPGRDGYEVIDACRRLKPHLPILGMSGGAEGADAQSLLSGARDLGAMVTLAKPFSDAELVSVVDEIFRRRGQPQPDALEKPREKEKEKEKEKPKDKERRSVFDLLRWPKAK